MNRIVKVVQTTLTPRASKDTRPNGHWEFEQRIDPAAYAGFVYGIYDIERNMKYIGRKDLRSKTGKESDWKIYKTSCDELRERMTAMGEEFFERIVLGLYRTRAGLAYAETWSLVHSGSALREDFYNVLIPEVGWKVHEPVSDSHKLAIERFLKIGA